MRLICFLVLVCSLGQSQSTLLLFNGKIVTVDAKFSVAPAMVVRADRVAAVGPMGDMTRLAGPRAQRIDLKGKTVLPGLMDSHVHAGGASLYEFDHTVPDMETLADVLGYIKGRVAQAKEGEWIRVSQVFITRIREQRFPTRAELDRIAPKNPIYFSTGPDASLNSLALRLSGIEKAFEIKDGLPGRIERDATGEPTGIIRNCARFVKYQPKLRVPTSAEKQARLKQLLADYNSVGLTSVADRNTSDDEVEVFRQLYSKGELTCRAFLTYAVDAQLPFTEIDTLISKAAKDPLDAYNNMLWLLA